MSDPEWSTWSPEREHERISNQTHLSDDYWVRCAVCRKYGPQDETDPYEASLEGIRVKADSVRICHPCKELASSFGTNYTFFIPR